MDDVEAKLVDTEKEAEKARKDSKTARDQYNDVKKRRSVNSHRLATYHTDAIGDSCEMFNKAYNHISERIDQVYKDLTKGKASPMGGVAYLSLEDSEVSTTAHKTIPSQTYFRNLMLPGLNTTPCLP